jgi:hypothetical protein
MRAKPGVQAVRRSRRVRWGVVRPAGVLAGVLAAVLASAAPAWAKGPQSLSISGPGLATPIEVSYTSHPDEWSHIDTGVWHALPGETDAALLADAPTDDLGSHYTLTWQVMTGPEETTPIRQDLYLDAPGGPLVYTPAGQPIWDGVTRGGWYRPPERLRDVLASVGVPVAGASRKEASASRLTASSAPASGGEPAASASGDAPWPVAITGLAAALAVAGLGGALALRRTRRRAHARRMATT